MPGKSKKGGGLESKPAYNLKPVPADKQKSLGKLPTDVRNKMGYMMDSSHSFKSKTAANMKTMYMGSVYSQDPEVGDLQAQDDVLKKITGISETEPTESIEKIETTNYGGKQMKLNEEQAAWRDKEIERLGGVQAYRNFYKIGKPTTTVEEKKTTTPGTKEIDLGDLTRTYDTGSNFDRRQQIRGVTQGERKEKRANIKVTGLENRLSKAKPGSTRAKKLQAKLDAAKNKKARIGEINRQTQLQEEQGLIGGGKKSIQKFTPSVAGTTGRDTRKFSEQTMRMSPKSMNYFNRKKK
jgi:hypothetical protein